MASASLKSADSFLSDCGHAVEVRHDDDCSDDGSMRSDGEEIAEAEAAAEGSQLAEQATKRRKLKQPGPRLTRTRSVGPVRVQDLDDWVLHGCDSLSQHQLICNVHDKLRNHLWMSSDYSGAGTAEQVGDMIADFLVKEGHEVKGIKHYRACDVDSACAKVLKQSGVEHFFPDLLDRMENETVDTLLQVIAKHSARKPVPLGKKPSPCQRRNYKAAMKKASDALAEELAPLILSGSLKICREAFCSVHDTMCPVDVERSLHEFTLWVVGNCCQDWTTMGKCLFWLGTGTLAFVAYLLHVLEALPDAIVQECTCGFDISLWQAVLGQHYDIQVRKLSPQQFGVPCRRERMYSASILKAKYKFVVELDSGTFDDLFFRSVLLKGDCYFQAPQAERDAMVQHLAQTRGLPGTHWSLAEALSPGSLMHLEGYHMIAQANFPADEVVLVNLTQNPSERAMVSTDVPVLLRESMYALIQSPDIGVGEGTELIMTGNEKLSSMGWPVFRPSTVFAWRHLLEHMSEKTKGQLAGNGMSLHVRGPMLLYILGCTERVGGGSTVGQEKSGFVDGDT